MGTQKHRNLTVDTLEVTGALTVNGQPYTPGGDTINVTVEEHHEQAIIPAGFTPAEFGERATVKEVAQAYQNLIEALISTGVLVPGLPAPEAPTEPAPAPEGQPAPADAPEGQG